MTCEAEFMGVSGTPSDLGFILGSLASRSCVAMPPPGNISSRLALALKGMRNRARKQLGK